jgi:uncharacterized protein YbaP (TraB family)
MKKALFLLFLIQVISINSQNENSLLWKISGNGLEKDSYLFGTMHVSQKIAFHLDDIFFEVLKKSDFVALESDPNLWLDHSFNSRDMLLGMNAYLNNTNVSFYTKSFELKQIKDEHLTAFISQDNSLLNGLLYRSDKMMDNFQEDTYLDMFVYQGGSKFGKKIYSLEDLERSSSLVEKANIDPMKSKPDLWLQKLLKDNTYYNLLKNSYRDRNISLLDSINKGMYNENHMKYMLYLRNEEMANNMDTIMKKGSLFAGIGAAHLAGEKGVLNMLKNKGYTISPLVSEQTEKGAKIKEEIENKFVVKEYTPQTSSDGFFTINIPSKLYELSIMNNTLYISPDLTNGAFLMISRISTFDFFNEKKRSIDNIDKLLYENIPGKIISKKLIQNGGFDGLDIINKTKTGDYQRYQIFVTPLEVIIFKMGGKKEFVKNLGSQLFESIKFNHTSQKQTINVGPKFGGFNINVPQLHTFVNKDKVGPRLLQAYDTEKNEYYFAKEVILNDTEYLEEDDFELQRIHERFYKNIDYVYNDGVYKDNEYRSFVSHTQMKDQEGRFLHLKTVIKGGHYYLLGCIRNSKKEPLTFFNSFKIKSHQIDHEKYSIRKDTSLWFSVNTTIKPPKNYNPYAFSKKKKGYLPISKNNSYQSDANEQVNVSFKKFHDYANYENIDSLWNKLTVSYELSPEKLMYLLEVENMNSNLYQKLFSRLYVSNKKTKKDKNGFEQLTYLLKDSLSRKAVRVKNIYKNGVLYELKTLTDTIYKSSKFIDEFYNSFTPKDTIIGTSLFTDKTDLFFNALKEKDSVVFDSYQIISFHEKDTKRLIDVISNYDFDENQMSVKTHLIEELGRLDDKRVKPFLEKLYKDSYENSYNQIAVFESFANHKTKESSKKILDLLEYDIPLSSNSYDISNMISRLKDSLSLTQTLFPKLLNYSSVEEYKTPIYKLLLTAIDSNFVKPSSYKGYKKQLLTEAKMEFKRMLSKKIKDNTFSENNYNNYNNNKNSDLNRYIKLLFPFKEDTNVAKFLLKLSSLDDFSVNLTHLILKLKAGEKTTQKSILSLASKMESRALLYKELEKIKRTNLFPSAYKKQQLIAESLLFNKRFSKEESKDSLTFIEKQEISISKKEYEIFLFKTKKYNSYNPSKENPWKLNFIVFEKKKNGAIQTNVYEKKSNQKIDETKQLAEIIDNYIEEIKLRNRKRVNLENNDYSGYENTIF